MNNPSIQKRKLKQLLVAPVFLAILSLGWRLPWLGYFIPFCMVVGVGSGFFKGRKWCDWYCPRGSFYDSLVGLASPQKTIPGLFRNIYFRSGILLVLMAIMAVNIISLWPDARKIGMFFVVMLTVTSVLGIILGLIWQQRSWCMVCPIGTIINLTGASKRRLMINSELCIGCKACRDVCPVQIKPDQYKTQGWQSVGDRDCLQCGLCVSACPKKALSLQRSTSQNN